MSSKATSSAFQNKVGLLGYYGLAERTAPGRLRLSQRGVAVLRDDNAAAQRQARRAAVVAPEQFAILYRRYAGSALPAVDALSRTFEYDYGLGTDRARKTAEAFIGSLAAADLINDDGSVEDSAELTVEADPRPDEHVRPVARTTPPRASDSSKGSPRRSSSQRGMEIPADDGGDTDDRPLRGAQIIVNLDVAALCTEAALEFLRQLGVAPRTLPETDG
jgi:hypothetical protein